MDLNLTPPRSNTRKTTLIMFLTLLIGFLIINTKMVAPYLLTILMGAILAVLSYPLYERLRGKGMGRPWASLCITLGIFILIVGPICLFSALAIKQGMSLGQQLSTNGSISMETITSKVDKIPMMKKLIGDPEASEKKIREVMQSAGSSAGKTFLGLLAGLPGVALEMILAAVACYFFLIDGIHFLNWLNNKIPLDPDVRVKLIDSFKGTAVSTTWSAMAGALTQAVFLILGFIISGVPGIFLAGGVAFILAWIPIVGSIPVWLIGGGYLIAQQKTGMLLVLLVFGLLAGIADNIVRPWILKGQGDMHSLVGLLAIFGGIDMFGICGVFYGPILMSGLIALLEIWPLVGTRFGIFFDSKIDVNPGGP